jgi:hypothetical protein
MSKAAQSSAFAQREWLNQILKETGLTPSGLAAKSGVWPSTLLRFLEEPGESLRALRASTIDKISDATGFAPPETATSALMRRVTRGFRNDAIPFEANNHRDGDTIENALRALKGKRNSADGWTLKTRSLEGIGLLPGDVVLVDLSRHAQQGDIVCAQLYGADGKATETTFRIYEPPYLIAASNDPNLRKPLLVDNERVVVMGVITHEIRDLRKVA